MPTIGPFPQPKQSRALLQSWRIIGPNMAQTLPQHLFDNWEFKSNVAVALDTPHRETKREEQKKNIGIGLTGGAEGEVDTRSDAGSGNRSYCTPKHAKAARKSWFSAELTNVPSHIHGLRHRHKSTTVLLHTTYIHTRWYVKPFHLVVLYVQCPSLSKLWCLCVFRAVERHRQPAHVH